MDLQPADIKADHRGILYEVVKLPHDGQVFVITILPGKVRGNHYHTHKVEKFTVVSGGMEFTSRDRATGEITTLNCHADTPQTVTVYPFNTHRITGLDSGATIVCWVSEVFDPTDPDTFAEDI